MPTLTDLFKAQKADKYTQDGRETLDKVYQIGEISQKTGLQKTANGWVQPKNGAPKGAGIPKEATGTETRIQKYNRLMKENISKVEMLKNKPYKDVKSQLEKMGYILQGHSGWEPFGSERGLPEIELYRDRNGNAKISIAPYVEQKEMNMPKLITETTKESAGTEKDGFKAHHEAIESVENGNLDEQIVNTAGDIEEMRDIARDVLDATDYDDPEEFAKDVESITSSMERRYQRLERRATAPAPQRKAQTSNQDEIGKFYTKFDDVQGAYDAGRQTFPEGGYTIFKTPEGKYKVVDDPKTKQRMQDAGYEVEVDVPDGTTPQKSPSYAHDSAPRQLTGDTRLRLSQVTDRVYKPGEISEKTGLQKQTDGSWAPPRNGATKGSRNQTVAATQKPAASQKPAENKGMEKKKHTLEVGSEIKFKRTGQPITIKNIENYGGTKVVVGEYEHNGKKETNRFRLDELEYDKDEPKKEEKKSDPIAVGNTVKFKRTGQPIKITNVEHYGNTPIIVGEYEHNGKKETNRFRMDEISTN